MLRSIPVLAAAHGGRPAVNRRAREPQSGRAETVEDDGIGAYLGDEPLKNPRPVKALSTTTAMRIPATLSRC